MKYGFPKSEETIGRVVVQHYRIAFVLIEVWSHILKCECLLFLQTWISNHSEADVVLNLYNVTAKDEGEYICRANNFIGIAEATFWLDIYDPTAGKTIDSRLWMSFLAEKKISWTFLGLWLLNNLVFPPPLVLLSLQSQEIAMKKKPTTSGSVDMLENQKRIHLWS